MKLSLIINHYREPEMLKMSLGYAEKALAYLKESSGAETEIIVTDSETLEKTAQMMRTLFPEVLFLAEEKPTSVHIFYDDQDVHNIKSGQLPYFRRRIGVVVQDYKLLGTKTVQENVAYVMEVMGSGEREISKNVAKVLEITGLAERANNFPEELSGGERQRAAIARALIHRPDVILADEPTGNLDPFHTKEIIRLLDRINQMGTTILLATHNKSVINTLKKRVVTLDQG